METAHVHTDACDHDEESAADAAPKVRIHGQHVYFLTEGSDMDDAYVAARAMDLRVLEVKRIRKNVPGVKVDKEIEVEETAEDGTKSVVKKTVQVFAEMQPGAYRKLGDDVGLLQERVKSNSLGLETVVETKFLYAVKAMARPEDTLI
jgi:hypothetical protein